MSIPPPDVPHKVPTVAKADPAGPQSRTARKEARLKAALKANMARRKAQVRARTGGNDGAQTDNMDE